MNALGLIEVNGYLAAIEAADAALKAANVKLIGLEIVNAGITNVQITGDVGAVKASVDAGKMAAEKLGLLRAAHVIPRLNNEVAKLFPTMNKENPPSVVGEEESEQDLLIYSSNNLNTDVEKDEVIEIQENISNEEIKKEENTGITKEEEDEKVERSLSEKTSEYYNLLKVDELRSLVRKLNIATMTNKQIKFARKDELINILLQYKEEGEK
ncbi:BMC domain-containing protein [Clostridium sp.]|uniref:BMC domain-containing protein n=1 Tax=Clostridium sp. TaxID=1506 RepID=UPI003F2BFFAB